MTEFSADQPPPTRFQPGPGQIGANAALKQHAGAGGSSRPARPQPGAPVQRPARGAIGVPSQRVAVSNADHLHLYTRYRNAQDLGRDLPFALWSLHEGHGGGWDLFWDGM
jgi:hypothetical protein